MKPPTWITVTQEHIDQGIPKSEDACPIALALRAVWPEPVTIVSVLPETASVYTIGGCYSADVWPEEAAEFIDHFDFGQHVEPFSFEIDWDFNDEGGVTS